MSRGAPPGAQDNGLPATSSWAPLGECDPRVTSHLLAQLGAAAIPAYAQPSTGSRGSYLELRPPRRPMDSVYVDSGSQQAARDLLVGQLGDGEPAADAPREAELAQTSEPNAQAAEADTDALFAAIIAGFHDTGLPNTGLPNTGLPNTGPPDTSPPNGGDTTALPRRPTTPPAKPGDVPRRRRTDREPGLLDPGGLLYDSTIGEGTPPRGQDPFDGDDEHFERPPAPPAPPMHPVTKLSVIAIVAGILLLLAPAVITLSDLGVSSTVGAMLVAGGTVGLIVRLRDDPPDDRDDGGAVV